MEWMVEKCVEIGIEKFSFVLCQTSERRVISLDRLEKIAVSAMKQSRQATLPALEPMVPFDLFIRQQTAPLKFIAHAGGTNPVLLKDLAVPGAACVILIGPEGDFNSRELAAATSAGFQKVSLGPNRLRTETAGLAAVFTLNLVNQK